MENRQNIRCEWMAKNNALINIDGQVYPCCYLANSFTLRNIFGPDLKDFPDEMKYGGRQWKKSDHTGDARPYLAEEYFKNKDELNLKKNSLENILNHEWFIKTLPESWDDENLTHRLCKKYCTVSSEHYHPNKSRSRHEEEE